MQKQRRVKQRDARTREGSGVGVEERSEQEESRQQQTRIKGRVREGMLEELKRKLREIVREEKHRIPGLQEGFLDSNDADPDAVELVLNWCRGEPSEEERAETEAALVALREELAGIVEWAPEEHWDLLVLEGGLRGMDAGDTK